MGWIVGAVCLSASVMMACSAVVLIKCERSKGLFVLFISVRAFFLFVVPGGAPPSDQMASASCSIYCGACAGAVAGASAGWGSGSGCGSVGAGSGASAGACCKCGGVKPVGWYSSPAGVKPSRLATWRALNI